MCCGEPCTLHKTFSDVMILSHTKRNQLIKKQAWSSADERRLKQEFRAETVTTKIQTFPSHGVLQRNHIVPRRKYPVLAEISSYPNKRKPSETLSKMSTVSKKRSVPTAIIRGLRSIKNKIF